MKRFISIVTVTLSLIIGSSGIWAIERPAEDPVTRITASSSIEEIRAELAEMEIPVLDFTFQNNEFPSFDVINAPSGCIGTGITNNNHVPGSFKITLGKEVLYESGPYVEKESGVRVKTRGNTSTAADYVKKKSYKVKLSKKEDLLFRGDKNLRDKDWALIGNGSSKMKYVGATELARICGIPWEPYGRHVCVIMNNTYMGSYYLVETVKGGEHRVDIDDTGYIIENDAYWWKPGETYFKSNNLPYFVGWTFSEPDPDDFEEDTLDNIKEVINIFEDTLYSGGDISEMYDEENFVNWLVAHDLLATDDALGSNIYVIKRNYNPDNIFETKLEMGPLWDFDDSFKFSTEVHANIFKSTGFWYKKLLENQEFREKYIARFNQIKEILVKELIPYVEKYVYANPSLYKARIIDYKRSLLGYTPLTSPYDDCEELEEWLTNRIAIIEKLIAEEKEAGVGGIENDDAEVIAIYNLQGQKVDSEYKGIILKRMSDGKTLKTIQR